MKPSVISKIHPWSSVAKNCESEIVARNIMAILARTGDEFRPITLDEYKTERLKDAKTDKSGWSHTEASIFENVSRYAESAVMAASFCKDWATALHKAVPRRPKK